PTRPSMKPANGPASSGVRQVLDCASPLALSEAWCVRKRQRTAAVQDAVAPLIAHCSIQPFVVMKIRIVLRHLHVATLLLTALPTFAADGVAVAGSIDARMFRYPAVSAKEIAFVYAGDIWVVPKSGGTATRLSSPRGEEAFPRFSPDGASLAFTGNYDGNQDIYVVPSGGGLPQRITYHGAPDRVLGWYPDGKQILFATSRTSEKDRFNQLYRISVEGGMAEALPVPYGEFGAISPDGRTLAFTTISVDFRTWKRYRGGMNPDIWLFDLEKLTAKNLTKNDADDSQPMWH